MMIHHLNFIYNISKKLCIIVSLSNGYYLTPLTMKKGLQKKIIWCKAVLYTKIYQTVKNEENW